MLGGIVSAAAVGKMGRATTLFREPTRKRDLLAAPRLVLRFAKCDMLVLQRCRRFRPKNIQSWLTARWH